MEFFVKARYCLLFWYHNERNWSIQNSSTIMKPKRDPQEYREGMLVVAKFQGKPYRAAIIRIEGKYFEMLSCNNQFNPFEDNTNLISFCYLDSYSTAFNWGLRYLVGMLTKGGGGRQGWRNQTDTKKCFSL